MYIYSSTGMNNITRNVECQDAYEVYERKSMTIFAVADGAGGALISGRAAKNVCREAVAYWRANSKYIKKASPESIAAYTIAVLQFHLKKEAKLCGHDYRKYCCTLMMGMLYKEKEKKKLITLHIGDGGIYELGGGGMICISSPQNGYSQYQTFFVNQSNAYEHCRVVRHDCTGTIAICSDGFDKCISNIGISMDQITEEVIKDRDLFEKIDKPDDTTILVV